MKSSDLDPKGLIRHKPFYEESSDLEVQLEFDFTERVFTINFFTIFDIMSTLGGFRASLTPVFSVMTPLIILLFLVRLSYIIRDKMTADYKQEHKVLLHIAKINLMSLSLSVENTDFHIKTDIMVMIRALINDIVQLEI